MIPIHSALRRPRARMGSLFGGPRLGVLGLAGAQDIQTDRLEPTPRSCVLAPVLSRRPRLALLLLAVLMLAGCQQRVGISSPSLADSPVAKLLPGPCVLEDGRIQCFDDDSTLAREHAVVDAKVGYDTICTLYQDRRLACTGLFGSQERRREFAGVDEFALGFNNLCILDRAVGVRCIDAPTWSGTGSVLHPDLLSASQLVAFGGGLVCALLEGDELRCKDIGDPERTLYQRDGVIQIASGDDVACLREHDGTVWCW